MIHFKKAEGNSVSLLQRLSLPIVFPEYPAFIRWQKLEQLENGSLEKCLQAAPFLTNVLARHAFYVRCFGTDMPMCTILHMAPEAFAAVYGLLPHLFGKVCAFPVKLSPGNEELIQLQVQSITPRASALAEGWITANCLPPELVRLYGGAAFPDDCRAAVLYAMVDDGEPALWEPDAFVKGLLADPLVKSLDVSGLTMQECAQNGLIRYIVRQKEETYLAVDDCSIRAGLFCKTLCWA